MSREPFTLSRMCYILAAVKAFGRQPLYLNILTPIIGVFEMLRFRWLWWAAMCLVVILCNILPVLIYNQQPLINLAKLGHLVGCVFFAQAIAKSKYTLSPADVLILCFLGVASIVCEIALGNSTERSDLAFGGLSRFAPLELDPNMSSQIFASLAAIMFGTGHWRHGFLASAVAGFSISRSAVLGICVAAVVAILSKFRILRLLLLFGLVVCSFLYPILFNAYSRSLDAQEQLKVNLATSERLSYHTAYFEMGLRNPIGGVGFFNAQDLVEDYMVIPRLDKEKILEQHSLFLQIWSEFGVITYGLVFLLLMRLCWYVAYKRPDMAPALACIVVLGSFNNMLTTWALWVVVGSCCNRSSDE